VCVRARARARAGVCACVGYIGVKNNKIFST